MVLLKNHKGSPLCIKFHQCRPDEYEGPALNYKEQSTLLAAPRHFQNAME